MRKQGSNERLAVYLLAAALCVLCAPRVWADVEIDLDDLAKPTSTPAVKLIPTAVPASQKPISVQPDGQRSLATTSIVLLAKESTLTPTPTALPSARLEEKLENTEDTEKPVVVEGHFKMKDIYKAGIHSYQGKDYDQAIRYFKAAVNKSDPETPKFYYAEAYAILGVIYQFHIIRYKTAYDYYKLALRYEKNNKTAKKHLKEVQKMLNRNSR